MEFKGPNLQYTKDERTKLNRYAMRRQRLKKEFEATPIELRKAFIQNFDVPPTEFEVQSYIFEHLDRLGFPVRGEIRTVCGSCIFDIVVFAAHHPDAEPIKIIEVKKEDEASYEPGGYNGHTGSVISKQVSRYAKCGLPVRIIYGPKHARNYIDAVYNGGFASL